MEKAAQPLPPGVVPSESREDVAALLGREGAQNDREKILREGPLSEDQGKEDTRTPGLGEGEDTPDTSTSVPSRAPPEAWPSPNQPERFHMDLSGDGDASTSGDSATARVPVKRGEEEEEEGGGTERKTWSPFTKPSNAVQDLHKEALLTGKKAHSQPQTTPKRPMSPLKRYNKVAPSPLPLPLSSEASLGEQKPHTLQSSSATLLDEAEGPPRERETKQRPGSAPLRKPGFHSQVVVVKSRTEDVEWESETQNQAGPGQPAELTPVEPLYSTVVKVKSKEKPSSSLEDLSPPTLPPREEQPFLRPSSADQATLNKITTGPTTPEVIVVMPKLECYEPTAEWDISTVITNPAMDQSLNRVPQAVSHDTHMMSHDPTYDIVEQPDGEPSTYSNDVDLPRYNPGLYKGLKKHENEKNVHLVSVKGISDLPEIQPMNFPVGSSQDMEPIHYAAATGDRKALSEILSALPVTQDPVEMVLGTDKLCKKEGVDVRDSEGRTPLMHAVHNDQLQCVKMLAEAGANANATANDGSTSLHQAAYSGTVEMIALLLSIGADALKRDSEGRTPLHWCTNNRDPQAVEILLDKVPGLDVNIRDGAFMTPLMWAAFHGKPEHIQKLKQRRADPALPDMDGMTAVHWAVQRHDTRALQALISSESSRYYDNKGKTVMHQAAEQGCGKAVSLIKAVRPTSVDDLDTNGRSPLHWATVCENPDVIRALLANGADPGIRDSSGRTALDYATERSLHYCTLLLTKTEGFEETDVGYNPVLTYGMTSATVGARALQQQEGQPLDPEELKRALTSEQVFQMQSVVRGSWINKFTNNGKGPLHPRFFWVNPSNIKICWSKNKDATGKDMKSDILVGVRSSASPAVFGRRDFDPLNRHKYSFTIFSASRVLDVVALSSEDFKIWLNGLQLLLHLGTANAPSLLRLIQTYND